MKARLRAGRASWLFFVRTWRACRQCQLLSFFRSFRRDERTIDVHQKSTTNRVATEKHGIPHPRAISQRNFDGPNHIHQAGGGNNDWATTQLPIGTADLAEFEQRHCYFSGWPRRVTLNREPHHGARTVALVRLLENTQYSRVQCGSLGAGIDLAFQRPRPQSWQIDSFSPTNNRMHGT